MTQTQKIFDASGVWITNTGNFAFVDPISGCRFESGLRTQAPHTEWIKSQGTLFTVELPKVEKKAAAPVTVKA